MKFGDMFQSNYFRLDDFDSAGRAFTITRVFQDELGENRERKNIVAFSECEQKLVLSKGRGMSLVELFGDESDNWVGKRITVYRGKAKSGKGTVDALCIREASDDDLPF